MNRRRFLISFGILGIVVLVLLLRSFLKGPPQSEDTFLPADSVEIYDPPRCPADRVLRVQFQSGHGETLQIETSRVLVQAHFCQRPGPEERVLARSAVDSSRWKKVRFLAAPGDLLDSARSKSGRLFLSASGVDVSPGSNEAWIFSEELSQFLRSSDVRNRILSDDDYLLAEDVSDQSSLQASKDKDVLYPSVGSEEVRSFRRLYFVKKSEILGTVLD
ncbi:MAG: hypothetical protein K2X47_20685 [Bdellovibrionales bacterium]|nr:hypothetical protein [Bdellovibrionales bacterium]